MKRLLAGVFVLLVVAACSDLGPTTPVELPPDFGDAQLDLVDGGNGSGGNSDFFFLRPLTDVKGVDGPPDAGQFPVVEICRRNAQGDGCAANTPLLAQFSRDATNKKAQIKVDDQGRYRAMWSMKEFAPAEDGIYRIRVLLYGTELGHADVITLPKREVKTYTQVGDDVIPIGDKGNFRISFFLGEGVLESQFCDYDGDGDVEDCDAGVEDPNDGQPTVVTVVDGNQVAAVITAPDGVFTDAQGIPIPGVVLTAEVETAPPSQDVILDDTREQPYFIEVNTFPDDVYIGGAGVSVVVCQDHAVLASRGITDALQPQLILYKVSDPKPGFPNGETQRLPSSVGAPECAAPPPAPAAQGLAAAVKGAVSGLLGWVAPEPLRARRLHGGLNTVIRRDVTSSDAAFSTFGATMGPNASQSTAIVPDGYIGQVTTVLIEVRTVFGDLMQFGGDTVVATVSAGPNAGTALAVTDNGNGTYSASYTPTVMGDDEISVSLTTGDGWPQGPIGGSPFTSTVRGPMSAGGFTNSRGLVATVAAWDPAGGPLSVSGPAGAWTCQVQQPAGISPDRAVCLEDVPPTAGLYTLSSGLGSFTTPLDATSSVPAAVIQNVSTQGTDVVIEWTGDTTAHGSYWLIVFDNGPRAEAFVSASTLTAGVGIASVDGSGLVPGRQYSVFVISVSQDLTLTAPLTPRVDMTQAGNSFVFSPN